jgi:hypothetical protein
VFRITAEAFLASNPQYGLGPEPQTQHEEEEEISAMKNILWMTAGFCAAAAGFVLWNTNRNQPIELLAHRLEDAWADHHTVV